MPDNNKKPSFFSKINLNENSSIQQHNVENSNDKNLLVGLDQEQVRARNQGVASEILNGTGRALAKVPGNIISNVAAITDIEDYYNQDNEVGNAVSKFVQETVNPAIDEALPIYRSNRGKALDVGSSDWWTDNMTSVLGSGLEFAITGAGVAGAVGKGLSLVGATGKVGQALNIGTNALALNQAESIVSAQQVYKNAYELNKKKGYSDEQAKQIAADAAAYTINVNRLNIPLNLTSAKMFLSTPKLTRQLVSNKGRQEILGELLREGSQEYGEEVINRVGEEEGRRLGEGQKQYSVGNTIKDVFSAEGAEAGLLGFLGGVAQTGFVEGLHEVNGQNKDQRQRYQEQQDILKQYDNLRTTVTGQQDLKNIIESAHVQSSLMNQIHEDEVNHRDDAADYKKNQLLQFQALNAFENGTTEQLIDTFKSYRENPEISQGNPQAGVKANEAIAKVELWEKQYQNIQSKNSKEKVNPLFNNTVEKENLNSKLTDVINRKNAIQARITSNELNGVPSLQEQAELADILLEESIVKEGLNSNAKDYEYIKSPEFNPEEYKQAKINSITGEQPEAVVNQEGEVVEEVPEVVNEEVTPTEDSVQSEEVLAEQPTESNPQEESVVAPEEIQQEEVVQEPINPVDEVNNVYANYVANKPKKSRKTKANVKVANKFFKQFYKELSPNQYQSPEEQSIAQEVINQLTTARDNGNVQTVKDIYESFKNHPIYSKTEVEITPEEVVVDKEVKTKESNPTEDKRAEIEKRRNESLDKLKSLSKEVSDVFSPKGEVNEKLLELGRFFQNNFGWKFEGKRKYPLYISKENNRAEFDIDGLEVNMPEGTSFRLSANQAYPDFKPEDLINVKYDAEIAALEKPKPETPKTKEEPPKKKYASLEGDGDTGRGGYTMLKTSATYTKNRAAENNEDRNRWNKFVDNFKGDVNDFLFEVVGKGHPLYNSLLTDSNKKAEKESGESGVFLVLTDKNGNRIKEDGKLLWTTPVKNAKNTKDYAVSPEHYSRVHNIEYKSGDEDNSQSPFRQHFENNEVPKHKEWRDKLLSGEYKYVKPSFISPGVVLFEENTLENQKSPVGSIFSDVNNPNLDGATIIVPTKPTTDEEGKNTNYSIEEYTPDGTKANVGKKLSLGSVYVKKGNRYFKLNSRSLNRSEQNTVLSLFEKITKANSKEILPLIRLYIRTTSPNIATGSNTLFIKDGVIHYSNNETVNPKDVKNDVGFKEFIKSRNRTADSKLIVNDGKAEKIIPKINENGEITEENAQTYNEFLFGKKPAFTTNLPSSDKQQYENSYFGFGEDSLVKDVPKESKVRTVEVKEAPKVEKSKDEVKQEEVTSKIAESILNGESIDDILVSNSFDISPEGLNNAINDLTKFNNSSLATSKKIGKQLGEMYSKLKKDYPSINPKDFMESYLGAESIGMDMKEFNEAIEEQLKTCGGL